MKDNEKEHEKLREDVKDKILKGRDLQAKLDQEKIAFDAEKNGCEKFMHAQKSSFEKREQHLTKREKQLSILEGQINDKIKQRINILEAQYRRKETSLDKLKSKVQEKEKSLDTKLDNILQAANAKLSERESLVNARESKIGGMEVKLQQQVEQYHHKTMVLEADFQAKLTKEQQILEHKVEEQKRKLQERETHSQ